MIARGALGSAGRRGRLLLTNLISGVVVGGFFVAGVALHDAGARGESTAPLRPIAFIRPHRRPPPPAPKKATRPVRRKAVKPRRSRLRAPHRAVAPSLVAPKVVPRSAERPPETAPEDVHLSTEGTDDPTKGIVGGAALPPPPDLGIGDGSESAPVVVPPPRPARRARPKTLFLRADMTPPRRIGGTDPVFTRQAREAGVSGLVVVLFTITPEGGVTNVRLLKSLPVLGEECARAVRRWRFEPVRYQGQSVSLIVKQPFVFKLDE